MNVLPTLLLRPLLDVVCDNVTVKNNYIIQPLIHSFSIDEHHDGVKTVLDSAVMKYQQIY